MNEANIPLKNFRLLCTQQSPLSQELLQTILVGLGADVCMARDAAALIDKLPGNYTAILTDLPDSGQEANQYIFRIRQKVPETPIVVVGQYQSFEGYTIPFGTEIIARISEPWSVSQFIQCLQPLQ